MTLNKTKLAVKRSVIFLCHFLDPDDLVWELLDESPLESFLASLLGRKPATQLKLHKIV